MLSSVFAYAPGDEFPLRSKSRPDIEYLMVVTPEGIVVHQGEGCEGEFFHGPTGCWHSKQSTRDAMTIETKNPGTAVVKATPITPAEIKFTDQDIETIKKTIARGVTDSELELFVATSRRTGLDPFMRQIWAIKRKTKIREESHMEGNRKVVDVPEHWEEAMTIQVGIDGYRLIAERTGRYQGMDGPYWSADGDKWLDTWNLEGNPRFAKAVVYRKDVERGYVATVRWDAYHQDNNMWRTMGAEQLAKCAEALALRRAFPAEMSGLPSGPALDYEETVTSVTQEPPPLEQGEPAPEASEGEYREINEPGESQQADEAVANAPSSEPAAPPPEEHGAPQQESPPDRAPEPAASPPEEGAASAIGHAATSAMVSPLYNLDPDKSTSERQRQAIADWQAAIEGKHGRASLRAVAGWMQASFPYCVNPETQRPSILNLKQQDAAMLIGFMHHLHETKDGTVPDGGFDHDADVTYLEDGKTLICRVCGVQRANPEEEEPPFDM